MRTKCLIVTALVVGIFWSVPATSNAQASNYIVWSSVGPGCAVVVGNGTNYTVTYDATGSYGVHADFGASAPADYTAYFTCSVMGLPNAQHIDQLELRAYDNWDATATVTATLYKQLQTDAGTTTSSVCTVSTTSDTDHNQSWLSSDCNTNLDYLYDGTNPYIYFVLVTMDRNQSQALELYSVALIENR
jgi:hypothetical protein